MRFCITALCLMLMAGEAIPAFCNPVYVHPRTHKAKKHKAPKHRSMQG